ncbi:hypothetical protein QAD02_023128 [Eretmocerus hayati]|uniref:Uncharacterized protein n=1 Tax=Eretmocerus hayati TaxID=131215 RepID=A0ACC2PXF8_9HYME|nr:hypothetical protein QAD02_023128 [Eretmocerus hayati]
MSHLNYNVSNDSLPREIIHKARDAVDECVPTRTESMYEKTYDAFVEWRRSMQINNTSEKLLIEYFNKLANIMAPPALFSKWSMLKAMIEKNENIDIDEYSYIEWLLKQRKIGFQRKRVPTSFLTDICTFLTKAPDADYLDVKVKHSLALSNSSIDRDDLFLSSMK